MATFQFIWWYCVSTVVLASTPAYETPQMISMPAWSNSSSLHTSFSTSLPHASRTTAEIANPTPHLRWNTTSPWGWNATRTLQPTGATDISYPTGTAPVPHPTAIVTVGEAGKLVFSPSSLNATIGSVIVFDFLGLNHTLTQSELWDPCRSNQLFGSGFHQFNPTNTSGKFVVEFKVVDQDPKWFFCAQTVKRSHCQAGMVFSLNPHGSHAQFLHNALAGIEAQPSNACELPSVDLTPSHTITHAATGTLSANASTSSVAVSPPIVNSASVKAMWQVGYLIALALL
ncbi:hypothetical protein KJE20_10882 [Pyrenophora tritici-repentis]|nr:hypothetical protein KJE20_10882 [Pyrenophora tritici-repentis]